MGTGGMRYGAGRPGWLGKAEHCLRLDVRVWKRKGSLHSGSSGSWSWTNASTGQERGSIGYHAVNNAVKLSYSVDDSPRAQCIGIEVTACHFGGTRPWFVCPVRGERVAVLFLRAGRFACRHCQRLAYASQSEDELARTWRRQRKAEDRLGEHWLRPKGMHHSTYERLIEVIGDCEAERDRAISLHLDALIARHPALRGEFGL